MKIKAADGFWESIGDTIRAMFLIMAFFVAPVIWAAIGVTTFAIIVILYLPTLGHIKKLWGVRCWLSRPLEGLFPD